MSSRIRVDDVDGHAIATFGEGKLLDDSVIAQVRDELLSVIDHYESDLVVDFTNVSFMSSAMIGVIVLLQKKAKANKRRLLISGLRPDVYEVFQCTKLNKCLNIYSDLQQAIRELGIETCLQTACPIATCGNDIRIDWEGRTECVIECFACENLLTIKREGLHTVRSATLVRFDVPTYEGQAIHVNCPTGDRRPVFKILVKDELDSFVSESLQKAWSSIPQPRAILIDLSGCTDISKLAGDQLACLKEDPKTWATVLFNEKFEIPKSITLPCYAIRQEATDDLLARSKDGAPRKQVDMSIRTVKTSSWLS